MNKKCKAISLVPTWMMHPFFPFYTPAAVLKDALVSAGSNPHFPARDEGLYYGLSLCAV
jgi:hypothetical protein